MWHYWDATEAGKYRSWSCGMQENRGSSCLISIISQLLNICQIHKKYNFFIYTQIQSTKEKVGHVAKHTGSHEDQLCYHKMARHCSTDARQASGDHSCLMRSFSSSASMVRQEFWQKRERPSQAGLQASQGMKTPCYGGRMDTYFEHFLHAWGHVS